MVSYWEQERENAVSVGQPDTGTRQLREMYIESDQYRMQRTVEIWLDSRCNISPMHRILALLSPR